MVVSNRFGELNRVFLMRIKKIVRQPFADRTRTYRQILMSIQVMLGMAGRGQRPWETTSASIRGA
jgi:hypothetical protein